MNKIVPLICIALVAICGTGRALDLTPHIVKRVTLQRSEDCPYFLDGKTRYKVNLPAKTSIWGEKGVAHFSFADMDGAVYVMKASPLKADLPFSGPSLEVYRQAVLSFIPEKATDVAIQKEKPNPLSINEWTSYEFIVASNSSGTRLMQSVTFLNFSPTEQIVLITTATGKQFDLAATKSSEIIRSLRSLQPDEDLSAPVYP